MKSTEITKFLVSFSGQIEHVTFPSGIFDEYLYIQYEVVWGPDWEPITGLPSGTSQLSRPGINPERVVINMPIEMTFGSTNVYGWPRLVITVKARNFITGDTLRGYAVVLLPPTAGRRRVTSPLLRPKPATVLGEWVAWLTGRYPELNDPKMLADGKDNYMLRTQSSGTVMVSAAMVSKDLRKLGYDNEPPAYIKYS
ncbi:B9 domain-containing protein 1 [Bombyx mandarina]|uniref:B9 domain-containing protein 1 n=1 Tax=Bombyx mandarina TaxID=7092 RepID=A0A6J2JHR5_BOMMA|nr:B9 domain-containing protein 1 [Bombyx mandarina]